MYPLFGCHSCNTQSFYNSHSFTNRNDISEYSIFLKKHLNIMLQNIVRIYHSRNIYRYSCRKTLIRYLLGKVYIWLGNLWDLKPISSNQESQQLNFYCTISTNHICKKKISNHICSLIFLPPNSTVFILKSIPANQNNIK